MTSTDAPFTRFLPALALSLSLLAAAMSPTAAPAAPYSNGTYAFAFDIPAGWTLDARAQGVAVALVKDKEPFSQMRVYAARRDHSLGKQDLQKMGAQEESTLRKSGATPRTIDVQAAPVDGLTAHGFGFAYDDTAGSAHVDRSIVFEKIQGDQPIWFRVRLTSAKAQSDAVAKDLALLLSSWHFQAGQATAHTGEGTTGQVQGGSGTGSGGGQATSSPAPDQAAPDQQGSSTVSADLQDQLKDVKTMSADETKANWDAMKPNMETRNEEAKRRARALFGGIGNGASGK